MFPADTLSVNDRFKFSENMKQGFKRTIFSNKCRSKITTQPNNLDYMIAPALRNINRLFVLSFKNGVNNLTRSSFDEYYMLLVKSKILMH